MIMNGVKALILRFFPRNSIALHADYVTVVEDRAIMSIKYCLPVPVFHFWPKLTHPAAQYLCDSWASYLVLKLIPLAENWFRSCLFCITNSKITSQIIGNVICVLTTAASSHYAGDARPRPSLRRSMLCSRSVGTWRMRAGLADPEALAFSR